MIKLDKLLEYVQRTNPEMTKEKLIKELNKSHYSAAALVFTWENSKIKQGS